ncbi:hypothetical protein R3P38DRAFT_3263811 [Favolaschia claudopus]|uniref:Uncharacterized protein n=1 Tax=Favolaschia claudopus TaxID=2862362 RepID=A0AAW0CAY8_9AGAR
MPLFSPPFSVVLFHDVQTVFLCPSQARSVALQRRYLPLIGRLSSVARSNTSTHLRCSHSAGVLYSTTQYYSHAYFMDYPAMSLADRREQGQTNPSPTIIDINCLTSSSFSSQSALAGGGGVCDHAELISVVQRTPSGGLSVPPPPFHHPGDRCGAAHPKTRLTGSRNQDQRPFSLFTF